MYSWMHTWVQTHVVQGSAVFCNVPVRTQTGQQAMLIVTQGIGVGLTGKRERCEKNWRALRDCSPR